MKTLKVEFEGVDGCGKTTSLRYFIDQANKKGLTVVETREVGNPNVPICVKLRELVLNPDSNLSGQAMELIFSAMRFENDLWLKNLKESDNSPDLVISDRGFLSHTAYTEHNVSVDFSDKLYNKFLFNLTAYPDVVIYLSIDTNTALQRRQKRGSGMDVIEMKGVGFQEKVRNSFENHLYQTSMNENVKHIFHVDANQDISGVQVQLDVILEKLISLR
jgi:dTMP kinase